MANVNVMVPGGFVLGEQVVIEEIANLEERAKIEAFLRVTATALRCEVDDLMVLINAKYQMGIANTEQPYVVLRRSAVIGVMATTISLT